MHSIYHIFICWVLLPGILFPGFQLPSSRDSIQIVTNQADPEYPNAVTFILAASTPSGSIRTVHIEYGSNARTCLNSTISRTVDITPGNTIQTEWVWDLSSILLPPGGVVWWQWTITDSYGTTITTPRKELALVDDKYQWQSLNSEKVAVYWYEGETAFGNQMLILAKKSLNRLEKDAGISLPEKVNMYLYPNTASLRESMGNAPDWAGGVAIPEYSTVMIGLGPDEDEWAAEVIPHELAHLVTDATLFNCEGGQIPTWMSEGLAVYSENSLGEEENEQILTALKRGTLPPLYSLAGGFAANATKADMAYTQSGAVVTYLLTTYGPEKMNDLLMCIRTGKRIDPCLEDTYTMNTGELDAAWRTSLGFASTPAPTPEGSVTPGGKKRTAVPTLSLWTAVVQSPTVESSPTADIQFATSTPVQPSSTPSPTATIIPEPQKNTGGIFFFVGGGVLLLVLGALIIWLIRQRTH